jgi:putative nucleotidyltransferase with HDIG domain
VTVTTTRRPHHLSETERLRKQLERQDMVLEITRLLSQEINRGVDYLLPLMADKTCVALNADRTTMYLMDADGQHLRTRVASELEIREIRIPVGSGMAGIVAATGETLNITNCYADPRWSGGPGPKIDEQTGYKTCSMLVMPMRSTEGYVLGVFQVINKLHEDSSLPGDDPADWPTFTEEDIEFLGSISASAAIAVQNALLVDQVRGMFDSTVQVLATALDRRNPSTAGHSQRVAQSAAILARHVGLSPNEVEKVRLAGLLHDIGKVGILDRYLTKEGPLDDAEFAEMKKHALFTRQILDEVQFLRGYEEVSLIAGQHHEKLDGSGYPFGQRGEEITLGGRLLAVVDAYDALRERRVYKEPFSVEKTLEILHADAERQRLDPLVVSLLGQCVEEIETVCGPLRPV